MNIRTGKEAGNLLRKETVFAEAGLKGRGAGKAVIMTGMTGKAVFEMIVMREERFRAEGSREGPAEDNLMKEIPPGGVRVAAIQKGRCGRREAQETGVQEVAGQISVRTGDGKMNMIHRPAAKGRNGGPGICRTAEAPAEEKIYAGILKAAGKTATGIRVRPPVVLRSGDEDPMLISSPVKRETEGGRRKNVVAEVSGEERTAVILRKAAGKTTTGNRVRPPGVRPPGVRPPGVRPPGVLRSGDEDPMLISSPVKRETEGGRRKNAVAEASGEERTAGVLRKIAGKTTIGIRVRPTGVRPSGVRPAGIATTVRVPDRGIKAEGRW